VAAVDIEIICFANLKERLWLQDFLLAFYRRVFHSQFYATSSNNFSYTEHR